MSKPLAQIPLEHADKERLRLWLRLLKTTRSIEASLRENFREAFGTTLPRFDVMAALSRFDDGLKMSEISGVLKVSNGNVTGIVDRLADDGMLVRVAVPGDRRAQRVRLTQRGQEEFARQAKAHEGWISAALESFSAEEARDVLTRFSVPDQMMEDGDAQ